jgi:NAD-dependent DNA ligase
VFALGIDFVGEIAARLPRAALRHHGRAHGRHRAEVLAVRGVGDVIARSVVRWFADPAARDLVERLRARGLTFAEPDSAAGTALRGMTGGAHRHAADAVARGRDEARRAPRRAGDEQRVEQDQPRRGRRRRREQAGEGAALGVRVATEEELHAIIARGGLGDATSPADGAEAADTPQPKKRKSRKAAGEPSAEPSAEVRDGPTAGAVTE